MVFEKILEMKQNNPMLFYALVIVIIIVIIFAISKFTGWSPMSLFQAKPAKANADQILDQLEKSGAVTTASSSADTSGDQAAGADTL